MEIEEKSQSYNSCVYTYKVKWKTEAITQMISIKTSSSSEISIKWRYNMGDSYFLAWIIQIIASSLHYSYLDIA